MFLLSFTSYMVLSSIQQKIIDLESDFKMYINFFPHAKKKQYFIHPLHTRLFTTQK